MLRDILLPSQLHEIYKEYKITVSTLTQEHEYYTNIRDADAYRLIEYESDSDQFLLIFRITHSSSLKYKQLCTSSAEMEKHFKNMEMKASETPRYLVLLQKKPENHESEGKVNRMHI